MKIALAVRMTRAVEYRQIELARRAEDGKVVLTQVHLFPLRRFEVLVAIFIHQPQPNIGYGIPSSVVHLAADGIVWTFGSAGGVTHLPLLHEGIGRIGGWRGGGRLRSFGCRGLA